MTAYELTYPHIEKLENQPARLRSHSRIRVAQIVMDYLAYGWSVEEMCRQHPYLTPAEAHAAMGYYFDHQPEIDQEIRAEWQQVQNDQAEAQHSPFYLRMKAQMTKEVSGGGGFLSRNSPWLTFGLGKNTEVQEILVQWPSGIVEKFQKLDANQAVTLVEGTGIVFNDYVEW